MKRARSGKRGHSPEAGGVVEDGLRPSAQVPWPIPGSGNQRDVSAGPPRDDGLSLVGRASDLPGPVPRPIRNMRTDPVPSTRRNSDELDRRAQRQRERAQTDSRFRMS